MKLTAAEQKNLAAVIQDFEAHSSIEFVPVLATEATPYYFEKAFFSFLISLTVGFIIAPLTPWHWDKIIWGHVLQAVLFLLFFATSKWWFFRIPLKQIQKYFQHTVQKTAISNFYELNLHQIKSNNGLLLFIAWREKLLYLVPDNSLIEKASREFWLGQVQHFSAPMHKLHHISEIAPMLKTALLSLQQKFPASHHGPHQNKENAMKDEIIIRK